MTENYKSRKVYNPRNPRQSAIQTMNTLHLQTQTAQLLRHYARGTYQEEPPSTLPIFQFSDPASEEWVLSKPQ